MAVRRRGTFAIEYAIVIVIAAAALIGMGIYFKRSISGKLRSVGDSFGYGRQYEPGRTRVSIPPCPPGSLCPPP